jgi:anti-sigma factor RsiW
VTCREFAEFLSQYTSNELSPETRAAFDRHLSLCDNCRQYLANYEQTIRIGRHAFGDDSGDVPLDVPEDLVQAILAARQSAS